METTTETQKRRRIMIITGDEDVLNQIHISSATFPIEPIVVEINNSNRNNHDLQTLTSEPRKQKTKAARKTLTCVVCGGEAIGYNFDAITCASCKAFFRRNGHKDPKSLLCEANEYCQINFKSIRRCGACRLIKCLNSGMRRDRLLTEEERAEKRRIIQENQQVTLSLHKQQPSLSSINTPSSYLSESLISSVVCTPIPRPILSTEEHEHIENIRQFYLKRIDLAAEDGLPWNPAMQPTSMLQFINCGSVTALRLLSFFKQIPQFAQLHIDDKMTLIKYNLVPITFLNASLNYKADADHFIEADSDAPCTPSEIQKLHKMNVLLKIRRIIGLLSEIGQPDERIIQLSLVILLCSKGFSAIKTESEPILNDTLAVFRVQSYYTELLWKYLETKNGLRETQRIFYKLLFHFIDLQNFNRDLYSNLQESLTPSHVEHILPIMKSLLLF